MSTYDFVIENGVLIKYVGAGGDVVIPEGVTEINTNAFRGCASLVTVSIPKGVTRIGFDAFSDCSALTSVVFPEELDVQDFGWCVFENCQMLTTISLPKGVDYLPPRTFAGCKSLVSVHLPETIEICGRGVFDGCDNLCDFGDIPQSAFSAIWAGAEEDFKMKLLFCLLKTKRIPPFAVAKIKRYKKELVKRAIAENDAASVETLFSLFKKLSLEELDEYLNISISAPSVSAFLIKYKLAVYPPERQEKIETEKAEKEMGLRSRSVADWKKIYVFEKLDNGLRIKKYKGDESVVEIPGFVGKEKVVAIGDEAFYQHKAMTSVILPDGVTEIGKSAFSGCTSLASIELPEGVTKIGAYAFFDCVALTAANVPDSVTEMGESAFSKCLSLTTFTIPKGVSTILSDTFSHCQKLESVIISDGVTTIGRGAFSYCHSLLSVNIPDSVKKIEEGAFFGCKGLADENGFVIFNNILHSYHGGEGVVVIPEGVKIGYGAFMSNESITSVTIPEHQKIIPDWAFYGCENLSSVTILGGITKIGESAFSFCVSLVSIDVPEGVKKIGECAFEECGSLESITIPKSVKTIGADAFFFCSNLTIHAPADSAAARYAQKNDIPFVAI